MPGVASLTWRRPATSAEATGSVMMGTCGGRRRARCGRARPPARALLVPGALIAMLFQAQLGAAVPRVVALGVAAAQGIGLALARHLDGDAHAVLREVVA